MRKQQGFSLIELLIVVAIILIIAAIAVPSLLRSRMLAQEAGAAQTVRALNQAQSQYRSTFGGYASSIAILGPPAGGCPAAPAIPTSANACLIDSALATGGVGLPGGREGYLYVVTPIGAGAPASDTTATPVFPNFVNSATPFLLGKSGSRDFCATDENTVHVRNPATGSVTTDIECNGLPVLNN